MTFPRPSSLAAYRFGRFEIRPATRQLLEGGIDRPIGRRAFDLLIALIERRDRAVSREELYRLIWPDVVVEPGNLHVQVWTLRSLLGREAVTTVARYGYRFTPPVPVADGVRSARHEDRPATDGTDAADARDATGVAGIAGIAGVGELPDPLLQVFGPHRLLTVVASDRPARQERGRTIIDALPAVRGLRVWRLDPAHGPRSRSGRFRPSACAAWQRLLARLAARPRLLVLVDGDAPVPHASAMVTDLLRALPQARVLAMVPAPLGLPGERVVQPVVSATGTTVVGDAAAARASDAFVAAAGDGARPPFLRWRSRSGPRRGPG